MVGQLALTVVLLTAAGLVLRSFVELQQVPIGFEPDRVLAVDSSTVGEPPDLTDPGDPVVDWVERRRLAERALSRRLQGLPGVRAAGAVFPVPLNGVYARTCSWSQTLADGGRRDGVAYFRNVWPGYFESLRIPLLAGRDFRYEDDQPRMAAWRLDEVEERTDTPRVVVDSRLAARLWPGADPVGRRLEFATFPTIRHDAEVIGVVPFVPQGGLDDPLETIYIPRSYYRSQELTLTVAVESDDTAARSAIAAAIREHFPDSPIAFRRLGDYVRRAMAPTRFLLALMLAFAGSALFLAGVGLYATMALSVRGRSGEIGVRLALGAAPARLARQVVGRALLLAAYGVVPGLLAGYAFSRLLGARLPEIATPDALTFGLAAVVQLMVALAAGWLPARRAAAVDP